MNDLREGRYDGLETLRSLLTKVTIQLEDLKDGCDVVRESNDLLGENMQANITKIEELFSEAIQKQLRLVEEAGH